MARYLFHIVDGPDKGKTFELEVGVTFVGRRDTPSSDEPLNSHRWVLTDPAVSRTHARVDWDGKESPILIHLSSTNATLLDGRIVTAESTTDGQALQEGNKLRMGQTTLEVVLSKDESRWSLKDTQDGETTLPIGSDRETVLDEVLQFSCSGSGVEVRLADPGAEVYLLRSIEGQVWSTSLHPESVISLKPHDIVRTEKRRLVLSDNNG